MDADKFKKDQRYKKIGQALKNNLKKRKIFQDKIKKIVANTK